MTTELTRQTFAVGASPTDLVTLNTRDTRLLSWSVTNLDGGQTVDVVFLSGVWANDDAGLSTLADLLAIAPGETRRVDQDVAMSDFVTARATASGAGCNVRISARNDRGRRP